MDKFEQATIKIHACRMCADAVPATHRFCRRCGTSQFDESWQVTTCPLGFGHELVDQAPHRTLSGALLDFFAEGTCTVALFKGENCFAMKLFSVFVAILIRLLIVLRLIL